jgi:hypothetical protein
MWFSQCHSELAFFDGFLRVIAQIEFKAVALERRVKHSQLGYRGFGEAEIIFVNFNSD